MKKMTKATQMKKNGGSSDPFYDYYKNHSSNSFKVKYGQDYANGTGEITTATYRGRTYVYFPQW